MWHLKGPSEKILQWKSPLKSQASLTQSNHTLKLCLFHPSAFSVLSEPNKPYFKQLTFYVAPFNDYFPTLGPHLETRKALQNHPSTDAARRPEGSADQRLDVSSRRG